MVSTPEGVCAEKIRSIAMSVWYAALAVHRLAQLSDLKLSFNVQPRAAASRVGIAVPRQILAGSRAGNGLQTLLALHPPATSCYHLLKKRADTA